MTLRIVYKICCGIDVHKTFVMACIASTDSSGVTTYERHRFSTYAKGLKDLLQWLLKHNCKGVCYVKAICGKKTNKKDAKWIASLFKHDLVAVSFMPPR